MLLRCVSYVVSTQALTPRDLFCEMHFVWRAAEVAPLFHRNLRTKWDLQARECTVRVHTLPINDEVQLLRAIEIVDEYGDCRLICQQ